MGERKVLNKYYPPDFDPSIIPKKKWDNAAQLKVRVMLPFSLQCNVCGEYTYRGKKFNGRIEKDLGPNGKYLGQIQIRERGYLRLDRSQRQPEPVAHLVCIHAITTERRDLVTEVQILLCIERLHLLFAQDRSEDVLQCDRVDDRVLQRANDRMDTDHRRVPCDEVHV